MFRFGKKKVEKDKFLWHKNVKNMRDVNVDNLVISKLIETKSNTKYLREYLDEVVRPLFLKFRKMSAC